MDSGVSDIEVINKVLAGDSNAFGELVKKYQNYVFTLALRFTRRPLRKSNPSSAGVKPGGWSAKAQSFRACVSRWRVRSIAQS